MDSVVQKTKNSSYFIKRVLGAALTVGMLVGISVANYTPPVAGLRVTANITLANSKRNDPTNVAVWLEPVSSKSQAAAERQTKDPLEIKQKGKIFSPRVLISRVGQQVDFPNLDPFPHNIFSNSDVRKFDLGLYQAGESRSLTFNRPGVVPVYCNIHPQMKAYVVVVRTPYYGLSNKSGEVSINDVPPGKYTVKVWHERSNQDTLDELARVVTISPDKTSLGTIQVDETGGAFTLPHKNKDGKEYAPSN